MKKYLGSTILFVLLFSVVIFPGEALSGIAKAKTNSGTVDFTITVDAPEKSRDVKVWIPYPVSADYQTIENMRIEGNFDEQAVYRVKKTGSMALYVEWNRPAKERTIKISFGRIRYGEDDEKIQKSQGWGPGRSYAVSGRLSVYPY